MLTHASEVEEIVFWERNYNTPFLKDSLQSYLQASKPIHGPFKIVSSPPMEQDAAFAALAAGSIDVMVGSINLERETNFAPIYAPIDRGLAGFRICLIHKDNAAIDNALINNTALGANIHGKDLVQASIEKTIRIGLGDNWPDRDIYERNAFITQTADSYQSLFEMLKNKEFDCFSRSMQEIDEELKSLKQSQIVKESRLVFIYPNGAFLYTRSSDSKIHRRLAEGVATAIENGRYFETFDRYYGDILAQNRLYFRKLFFLQNTDLSPRALNAINQHGLASFKLGENPQN